MFSKYVLEIYTVFLTRQGSSLAGHREILLALICFHSSACDKLLIMSNRLNSSHNALPMNFLFV
jgi:hypothetical protein